MSTFVDTGVLFAAASSRDPAHERAASILESIQAEEPFTSDHVVVEAWSLIRLRLGFASAMRFWSGLRASAVSMEFVVPVDLEHAHAICGDWQDQELDIVDASSFALMERVGCRRVASFDKDFAVYRFGPDRKYAFEIVR